MVCVSCQRVSNIIITYINHQVNIFSSYGFSKDTFGFTRTKTRYAGIDQIILFLISGESNIILVLVSAPGWLNDYLFNTVWTLANTCISIGTVALIVEMFRAQRIYLQTEEQ